MNASEFNLPSSSIGIASATIGNIRKPSSDIPPNGPDYEVVSLLSSKNSKETLNQETRARKGTVFSPNSNANRAANGNKNRDASFNPKQEISLLAYTRVPNHKLALFTGNPNSHQELKTWLKSIMTPVKYVVEEDQFMFGLIVPFRGRGAKKWAYGVYNGLFGIKESRKPVHDMVKYDAGILEGFKTQEGGKGQKGEKGRGKKGLAFSSKKGKLGSPGASSGEEDTKKKSQDDPLVFALSMLTEEELLLNSQTLLKVLPFKKLAPECSEIWPANRAIMIEFATNRFSAVKVPRGSVGEERAIWHKFQLFRRGRIGHLKGKRKYIGKLMGSAEARECFRNMVD